MEVYSKIKAKNIEKCNVCKSKIYKYGRKGFEIELCYKCGKFSCNSNVSLGDLTFIIAEEPMIIPYLIKMEYLKPM